MIATALLAALALVAPRPASRPAPRALDVGAGAAYHTITAALAAARDGDTVRVHAGLYREPTIVVAKRVALIGDAADGAPVLDGGGTHGLLLVTADDVTIRGLVLRNVGTSFIEDRAALRVENARGCAIDHNRVEHGFFGIYLAKVTDCRVADNVLRASGTRETESGNGIHLWTSRRITIVGNDVAGFRDGIYFEFVHDSDIRGNTSAGNLRYGLHFMFSDDCRYVDNTFRHNGAGVAVMYTQRVTMVGNRFEDNWGAAAYGLLLKEIIDSRIERNVFARNTTGLLADGADRLVARGNTFDGNGWAVRLEGSTTDGRFTGNDFLANSFDVATSASSPTTTFTGNYWDAYRGYDLDRDGVGDVPYRPVRLFAVLVEHDPPALLLLRSAFVAVLDAAERALPSITPALLEDRAPAMHKLQ